MPLFSGKRDRILVRHLNRELIQRFISIECALYKLALPEMEINMYNESSKKVYYNPVRLFCLVNKDAATFNDVDTGLDTTQTVQFKFLRDDLRDVEVVLSEGDIIKYDGRYYEIDNTNEQQYWMGRNNETLPIEVEGRDNSSFGFNISIIAETHLTRLSQLNIVDIRSGVNSIKTSRTFPKNL